MQASSLLGHQALVNSSTATLAAGATVSGAVNVPQNTSQVTLSITNSSGALVSQINLGAQTAGLANFSWNGTTGSGGQAPATVDYTDDLTKVTDEEWKMATELTIRGVTKPVSLMVTFKPQGSGATLDVTGTVKRLDFGVGGGQYADTSVIGPDVKVTAHLVLAAK